MRIPKILILKIQEGYLSDIVHLLYVPLGADKTHSALKGVFSVFSNDENKNYDIIQSAWEFARNQEQPEVCSSIRLGVILF